ncbi:hypothetical protein I548_3301 [Mycobacterium intracellulare]|nr:hypothetical protein I548_3301 [Mycobacterium intracellulare]
MRISAVLQVNDVSEYNPRHRLQLDQRLPIRLPGCNTF